MHDTLDLINYFPLFPDFFLLGPQRKRSPSTSVDREWKYQSLIEVVLILFGHGSALPFEIFPAGPQIVVLGNLVTDEITAIR